MAETKFYGKYRAKVVDVNDPERRGRIRVQCPAVLGIYKSAWCEPCIPYATDFSGDYYVPPVGEAIWVEFEEGDVDKPIWNGGWYKIDSSPLLPESKPEDYRFISFKKSILRMGESEFIFELRNGDDSYVFKVDPSTVIGLSWVGSLSENDCNTLNDYIANSELIMVQVPEAIQSISDYISETVQPFLTESYPKDWNTLYETNLPEMLNNLYTEVQTDLTNLDKSLREYIEGIVKELEDLLTDLDNRVKALESGGSTE